MEVLLLGIYSFFVWLIFIKLKWLPWNTGTQRELVEQERGAAAKIEESQNRAREISARLELTKKRVTQYRELAATGAGSKFDLERAETDAAEQEGQLDAARNAEAQARASQR